MSTFCLSSIIIPLPLSVVWNSLRFFDFPRKYLRSVIDRVDVSGPSDVVGCTRKIFWKTGESQLQRLVHLSDYEHSLKWELVESDPPAEVTATISKIKLYRITEDNSTLLEWSAEYSSDVNQKLISFSQDSFYDNLIEIRAHLIEENGDLPILYHIREGASSRIVWLSYELGIPLNIKEASVDLSSSTEAPSDSGGLVSCYRESNIELIESGAILQYLLEKHDKYNTLLPKIGTIERVSYLKYLFYTSSTIDHLLMESYKELFVKGTPDQNIIKANQEQWFNIVAKELEEDLKKHKYIAGNKFSGADIMVGYSLYLANLLGWLQDSSPVLVNYWKLLNQRSYCKKALHLQ